MSGPVPKPVVCIEACIAFYYPTAATLVGGRMMGPRAVREAAAEHLSYERHCTKPTGEPNEWVQIRACRFEWDRLQEAVAALESARPSAADQEEP